MVEEDSTKKPEKRSFWRWCAWGLALVLLLIAGGWLIKECSQPGERAEDGKPTRFTRVQDRKPTRFTDFREFLKVPVFVGKVAVMETLPLRRDKKLYHSAAMSGYRLEIVSDSGEKYEVVQDYTDANWQWTGKKLKVGRTYLFPDAVVKDTEIDESKADFGRDRLPPDAAGRMLARKLLAIGFQETPKWSYSIRTDLKTFKKWFPSSGLRPIPCLAVGENKWWSSIEGNHAVVSAPSSLRPTAGGQIRLSDKVNMEKIFVQVFLEWARPEKLWCGMTESKALAALGMIGAKRVGEYASSFPRSHRFVLPDGTGLLLECIDPSKPREKPSQPLVRRLIVGEAGKGFSDWSSQKKSTPEAMPIWEYLRGRK